MEDGNCEEGVYNISDMQNEIEGGEIEGWNGTHHDNQKISEEEVELEPLYSSQKIEGFDSLQMEEIKALECKPTAGKDDDSKSTQVIYSCFFIRII